MTQTLEEIMEGSDPGRDGNRRGSNRPRTVFGRSRKRRPIDRRFAVMMLAAALGLGLIIYPQTADWFSSISHNSQLSGYAQDVEQLEPSARTRILDQAREYNSHIRPGQLRDPYSTPASAPTGKAQPLDYQSQLNVDHNEVMGRFRYPELNIDLPIFHGTSDDVLAKGVGHLYGSSLPVGGPGTHSVLTSHSGIPNAELFNPLHSAKTGDIFLTEIMDRTFQYRVTKIEVVTPDDISSLKIVPGEDSITLITCTPIGINSHRILVHASRIADNPSDFTDQKTIVPGQQTNVGFPFWAVYFLGGLMAFYLASRTWNRKRIPTASRAGR